MQEVQPYVGTLLPHLSIVMKIASNKNLVSGKVLYPPMKGIYQWKITEVLPFQLSVHKKIYTSQNSSITLSFPFLLCHLHSLGSN